MKVKDIMVRNVVSVGPNDSISAALNKIKKHNINQLPVMDKNRYAGMLTLKNIAVKNIDPKAAKCGNFIVNTPSLRSDEELEDATRMLLDSGLRALPVIDKGLVGILSETDIMSAAYRISKNVLDVSVGNIATECEYVTKDDKIGKVRKIMTYKNVSRVPVVDGGNIIGVVGVLDLVKLLEGKEGMQSRGGLLQEMGAKEKINIEETLVKSIMHSPFILNSDAKIKDAIDSLKRHEETIVSDGSVKIITPKDIIELIVSRAQKQVYVQIVGMHDESAILVSKIDQLVTEFIKKMERIVEGIQYLFLHVERHHKGGGRQKYSIRARCGTPMGLFVAKSWGWNPVTVAQEAMNNLEQEVIHKHGKLRTFAKKRRFLSKRG